MRTKHENRFVTTATRYEILRRIMLKILNLRYLSTFVILLTLASTMIADQSSRPLEKDGTFVVHVTWGDDNNTPASDAYVEAYGFVQKYHTEKSFLLKKTAPGRYETSLPPAVYDVFVSEGTSMPRCKRVLVTAGHAGDWTLKLKIDEIYQQRGATG
jgi:hypothetical protein